MDIIEDIIHHSTFYQNNSSQIYIQKLFLTTCKHEHTLYILKNICDYISLSIYLSFYVSKRQMSQQMPTEIYIYIFTIKWHYYVSSTAQSVNTEQRDENGVAV